MTMENRIEIELVGGPADGKYMVVERGVPVIMVPQRPPLPDINALAKSTADMLPHELRVQHAEYERCPGNPHRYLYCKPSQRRRRRRGGG